MLIILVCILLAIILIGCSVPSEQIPVQACSPIPSPRACATCFVVDNRAYIFGGRNAEGTYLNDLWRYDPQTDTWTDCGTTPLSPRVNATACVADGAVYIGLGFVGDTQGKGYYRDDAYLRDWYRYDPVTGTFTALAPYPNEATDKAICWAFTANGKTLIYAGYGFRYNYTRDIFCYDIPANQWDSIDTHTTPMGYPSRGFGGTGVVWHNRLFAGTGYRRYSLNWWAELLPDDNLQARWQKCREVPSPERTLSACTATNEAIYLAGGIHYGGLNTTGEVLQDMLRYQPDADRWTRIASLPQPLCNHVMFTIGKDVFVGLGETWQNDTLSITPNLYRLHED